MRRLRVIPILGISENKLVKTINYKNPKYIGDPLNAIKIFNDKEVDEISVIDITATAKKKAPNYQLIEDLAGECFMPLSYGGGIQCVDQAKKIFDVGVEKIILNTTCIKNPSFIEELAKQYGVQSIVVSVDIKKNIFGKYVLRYMSGSQKSRLPINTFVNKMESLGAGEILLNSVDNEGTFKGYDLDLCQLVSKNLSIPLVLNGGCNSIQNMKEALLAGTDSIAASSYFIYKNNDPKSILINYPNQQDLNIELIA